MGDETVCYCIIICRSHSCFISSNVVITCQGPVSIWRPSYQVWYFHYKDRLIWYKISSIKIVRSWHRLISITLRWRHNGRDGVSNHQPHHCLLNRLFGCRSKKTSKPRVTGLCAGNSPGTCEFPAQMASSAETFHLMTSSWWEIFYW